jgi:hypothetical protein
MLYQKYPVTTITNKDADLYHDMVNGQYVSGILHFCNQVLIDWYSMQKAMRSDQGFADQLAISWHTHSHNKFHVW